MERLRPKKVVGGILLGIPNFRPMVSADVVNTIAGSLRTAYLNYMMLHRPREEDTGIFIAVGRV